MKCPKCQFVSFDGLDECKKCGYNFVTKKGGKKFSFLSKIMEKFGGDDDREPIAKKTVSAVEPEVALSDPIPAEEPMPAPEPEAEPVSAPEPEASDEVAEEEDSFDGKFDSLFGDDKNAVKGGGDAIMITATDSHSEGGGDAGMDDMHDYGGFDPYSEVIVPSDDNDAIFEAGAEESIEEDIDIANDAFEDVNAVEPAPETGSTYGEVALKEDAPAAITAEEDDAAADFLKEVASGSDTLDDES